MPLQASVLPNRLSNYEWVDVGGGNNIAAGRADMVLYYLRPKTPVTQIFVTGEGLPCYKVYGLSGTRMCWKLQVNIRTRAVQIRTA